MFDKIRLKSKGNPLVLAALATSPGSAPDKKQIYRNRYNYGVNIGGCFICERWIFDQLAPDGCNCELEAVSRHVKDSGSDSTREKYESFWSLFLSDADWDWLQQHSVKSIRVPVGYWQIPGYAKNTKFASHAEVYKNAWSIVKSKFIEPAGEKNISVLIDLHGVPGGANGSDHSGEVSSGSAHFWSNSDFQLQVVELLQFIAKDLKPYDNIAGIQVVNESEFANDNKAQIRFYSAAINSIREVDQTIPIVISDGWWPDQWVKWVQHEQSDSKSLGVVVDHHVYRCFDDRDKQKSPQQIIDDLDKDVLTNLTNNGDGVDFMVGEFSCVLDGESWKRDGADAHRDDLVIQYGKRQLDIIKDRASFGNYFWTYKFQSGNGGEWDFKTMTDKGAISNPYDLRNKQLPDSSVFDNELNENAKNHEEYWNNQNPKEKYEHDRYKDGFTTGWMDSLEFAKFEGSVIGRIQAWKQSRLAEHIKAKGTSKHIWEWQQGFDTGVKQFKNNVH